MLKITPLGGTREIGLNMMVIEYGDTAFAIDAGLMFPEGYMLGVDIVLPDMDYVRSKKKDFAALVLTHGHEDHIGAIENLGDEGLVLEGRLPTHLRRSPSPEPFSQVSPELHLDVR